MTGRGTGRVEMGCSGSGCTAELAPRSIDLWNLVFAWLAWIAAADIKRKQSKGSCVHFTNMSKGPGRAARPPRRAVPRRASPLTDDV